MFSARLAEAIKRRGVKKSVLARAVGVTPGNLSRYLNGRIVPDRPVLLLLAQELDVSMEYLLGQPPNMATPPDRVVMRETDARYTPDAVSLVGLNADERQTILRMLDALRSGQADVRQHLIGQLKIIELVVQSRRKQPHQKDRSEL